MVDESSCLYMLAVSIMAVCCGEVSLLPYSAAAAGGALSIVEATTSRVKFAAGAYTGALDSSPSSMAVFLYYLNVSLTAGNKALLGIAAPYSNAAPYSSQFDAANSFEPLAHYIDPQ
jgi:hypothetical protein